MSAHAKREHVCQCGKVMHGNGYKNHLRSCKVRETILRESMLASMLRSHKS